MPSPFGGGMIRAKESVIVPEIEGRLRIFESRFTSEKIRASFSSGQHFNFPGDVSVSCA